MLPFLLFGLALLVGFMLLSRWVASADPATLAKGVRWVLVVVGVALVAYLAVSGRLFYAIAAAPVLIPTILRWASLVRAVRARASGGRPSGGQTSDVETGYLRMTLDHDSGTVNGTVTAGRFAGRQLSELSPDELTELLGECWANDPQAAALLETYLQSVFGEDWDAEAGPSPGGKERRADSSAPMTREEAYEVLGLKPGAGDDEIKRTHRELMVKLHPDQGGSNYLAARVNQAKDILLDGR